MTEFQAKAFIIFCGAILDIWLIWFCFIREQDDDYSSY
jgi:hypothetical protein